MKIVIMFDSFSLGGAEFHAFKLAKYLKYQCNQTVQIWVNSCGDGTIKNMCDAEEIPTKIIGEFSGIASTLYFRQVNHFKKIFKPFSPEVVISFNLKPNLLNSLVSKKAGVKCVVWSQQSVLNYTFSKKSEKKAVSNVDCFISNAFHASAVLQKALSLPENKFFVVHNGIETPKPEMSKNQWLSKLGISDADFKVLMLANITETKDHITLLKAWKRVVANIVASSQRKPVLILAGRSGSTINLVQKYILDNDLLPYVKLIGQVNDVSGLHHAMDLAVLSSKAEGLPNAVMEAMICSLPFVGTDIPGIREAVGDQNYQYLSPIENDEILAQKIEYFASNSEIAKQVGMSNKERIEKLFSLEKMGKETFDIIKQFL